MSEIKLIGGIPASLFHSAGEGEVVGQLSKPSREFIYTVNPLEIRIVDAVDKSFHFVADIRENNLLHLDIRTKGFNRSPQERHPDLFAKQLALAAASYFKANGRRIKGLIGDWTIEGRWKSEEADRFKAATDSGQTDEQAAMSTWTSHLAHELGFHRLESVERTTDSRGLPMIKAIFV